MTYLATLSGIMRLESTTDLFYRNGIWNPSGVADACAMPRFGPIHYPSDTKNCLTTSGLLLSPSSATDENFFLLLTGR